MAYSMPGRMNVLRIFIFCYSDAGDNSKAMLHFLIFGIVISFCMAHLGMGPIVFLGNCMVYFVRGWGVVVVVVVVYS